MAPSKDKDSSFIKCYPHIQRALNITYLIYNEFALLLFFRPFLRKYFFYIEKLEKQISDLCFRLKNICFKYFANYPNRNITLIHLVTSNFSLHFRPFS